MGSYNTAVITTVGQALLTSVLGAQGTMTFTKLQTSSYAYASGTDLSALTSLNNVEQEANIGTATIVDSTHIAADATISNSGISTEYNVNTLGIFASDGVNEVLFAVSTAVTPDVIPVDSGGTPSTYKYNFTLAVSSTSDITISAVGDFDASDIHYDNSVSGLSATNVQAAIDEIVSSVKRTGKITLSAVSVELTNAAPTATVSFTTNSDGVASVASSDPTIATASLSGTVVTITGVKGGKITVTISIPETEHYTACSATISVDSNILVIGETYFFGGFYWTAAEDLGDNAVCLQSQGMTAGYWPGYKLTTDYSGTKNYGSANTAYNGNIDGDNIANYDDVTSTWYSKYSAVEKTGASYGSGLFLVSNIKCNAPNNGDAGSGNYCSALKIAATNWESFGASTYDAYLGTIKQGYTNVWFVTPTNVYNISNQNVVYVIAPAFNLDLTKVKLVDGDHIMLPTEEMPTLKTFATATDAEIAAMVEASEKGIIDLYEDAGWRVGQEHQTSLSAIAASGTYDGVSWSVGEAQNAQNGTLVLMHHKPVGSVDTYKLVTATKCGRKIPSFAIGLKNAMETLGYMNATATNSGSWEATARRGWCNGGFREALNSTLRNIFKKFYCVTGDSNSTATGATNKTTQDYFALAAEKELFGAKTYCTDNELAALIQFTWYETSANRNKKQGDSGSVVNQHGRSPYYGGSSYFVGVNTTASAFLGDANEARGISPFGMIP